ncbi:relaxase/mobilization nuclease domain-containing protein [Notoacmeibacter sp. MSK16QG-6]|uniref:relaxase/mobilization nuclease domain-containing protein n=1 Tax=Notoacmeibacter sp. MSK16QG-6 TaxID=2957982 RepID=UPI00209FF1A2|nr:relaxase/mobilization nuclease domain-containing protein [Notoacmeibacter sp. MSK16QG-6]MCP1200616.1 relaxase/mobilization nuclease domain-containing protein [Notoacmeibacter sp. MSK16QG-6]
MPQAIVRVVPNGGAKTAGQIKDQWNYLTQNGAVDLQCSDRHQGVTVPRDRFAADAASWEAQTGNEHNPHRAGQDLTTHLVVSFPPPEHPDDPEQMEIYRQRAFAAARTWANRMFGPQHDSQSNEYDYRTAFHTNRPHPHLHITVNRRSTRGDWLKIAKRDPWFNYENMRKVLVNAAYDCGIELEATTREERGITERPVTYAEYRRRERTIMQRPITLEEHNRLEAERQQALGDARNRVGMDPETEETLQDAIHDAGAYTPPPDDDDNAGEGPSNAPPRRGMDTERTAEDLRRGCTPPAFEADRDVGDAPPDDGHDHGHDAGGGGSDGGSDHDSDNDDRGNPPPPQPRRRRRRSFDSLYDVSDEEDGNDNIDFGGAEMPHEDENLQDGARQPQERPASQNAQPAAGPSWQFRDTEARRKRRAADNEAEKQRSAKRARANGRAGDAEAGPSTRPTNANDPAPLNETTARQTGGGVTRKRGKGIGDGNVSSHQMEPRDTETRRDRPIAQPKSRRGGNHPMELRDIERPQKRKADKDELQAQQPAKRSRRNAQDGDAAADPSRQPRPERENTHQMDLRDTKARREHRDKTRDDGGNRQR